MNPQEPTIPDPAAPGTTPGGPVSDPDRPDQPEEYEGYDKADADSFPASDPPSATEP